MPRFCTIKHKTVKIYELIDPRNDDTRYIGRTVDDLRRRLSNHIGDAKKEKIIGGTRSHKANWILSIVDNNSRPIINQIDEVPVSEWQFWETWYIALYKSWGCKLVNKSNGGDGFEPGQKPHNFGVPCSEETKQKIREKRALQVISDNTKKKMSDAKKGKAPSYLDNPEKKANAIKKNNSIWKKGNVPWNVGVTGYKNMGRAIPVEKYSLAGEFISEYDNLWEAAMSIEYMCAGRLRKGNQDLISLAIRKGNGIYKNYLWKFK